jgi:hypothetical protein
MLFQRNPGSDLIRAYKQADRVAYRARHLACCYGQEEYEAEYRAYKEFRRTLYQYRPMPRLKAYTLLFCLLAIPVAFVCKLIF